MRIARVIAFTLAQWPIGDNLGIVTGADHAHGAASSVGKSLALAVPVRTALGRDALPRLDAGHQVALEQQRLTADAAQPERSAAAASVAMMRAINDPSYARGYSRKVKGMMRGMRSNDQTRSVPCSIPLYAAKVMPSVRMASCSSCAFGRQDVLAHASDVFPQRLVVWAGLKVVQVEFVVGHSRSLTDCAIRKHGMLS
jgi:hypothetical protein